MKQNKEEKMSIEELKALIAEVKAAKKKIDSLADALTDSSDDYISVCAGNDDLMADIYTFDQVRMYELTDAMDLLDAFVDGIESEFKDICTNAINDREGCAEEDCSPRALCLDSVQEDVNAILKACEEYRANE
nr:hypothetical protein [uncultured Butyrivibrio sp.]